MSHTSRSKLIAALVVLSATFAPAVSAQPIDYHPGVDGTQVTHPRAQTAIPLIGGSSPEATNTASSGFDWGDAVLGAGGMLILLSVGAAAVVTIRRRGRSHTVVIG